MSFITIPICDGCDARLDPHDNSIRITGDVNIFTGVDIIFEFYTANYSSKSAELHFCGPRCFKKFLKKIRK